MLLWIIYYLFIEFFMVLGRNTIYYLNYLNNQMSMFLPLLPCLLMFLFIIIYLF